MKTTMHCGYCLPCTIRRAAILKGELHDTSTYFDSRYKKAFLDSQDKHIRTYKCAFNNFDENNAFLRIQESGPIGENIEQFADLYVRGIERNERVFGENKCLIFTWMLICTLIYMIIEMKY